MYVLEYNKISNEIYKGLPAHCHSVYEIYYFIAGDAAITIEGKVYPLSPHTLILIRPTILHSIQVNTPETYIRDVLYFSTPDLMPERLNLLASLTPVNTSSGDLIYEHMESFRLHEFFRNFKLLEEQPEEVQTMLAPIFTESLLAQIYLISRSVKPASYSNQMPEKIMEITAYINANLTQAQSLDSIANHFYISKNYLNKSFRKYLGTTVMDYLRYKRVILAKQSIQAGESAINAAMQAGFSDYSSFYRAYVKHLGKAPRDDMTFY